MSAPRSEAAHGASLARDLSSQSVVTGLLVALIGYGSSVAVVVQGLAAVGATTAQIASGLVALGLAMGVLASALALRTRVPVSIAWSTPGLALLATTGAVDGGFPAAVGAFMVAGALIALAGLWAPLARAIAAIPRPLASAMLAGILLKLCLAPFAAIAQMPAVALVVLATWAVMLRLARLYAVPAALAAALAGMALAGGGELAMPVGGWLPGFEFVAPRFTWEAMASIALPLFIVTMASQNIPGVAVLAANGYEAPVRATFVSTGIGSAMIAPLGGPTVNFAAITAALCAGADSHPDPARRYVTALVAGLGYVLLALLAAVTATLVTSSTPVLMQAVAGLALLGALASALAGALAQEESRLPAMVTFLMAASGFSILGIGSAFLGLVLGFALDAVLRRA